MAWIPAWTHRPPRPLPAQRTSAAPNIPGTQPLAVMPPGVVIAQPYMLGVMPPMHLPPPPTLAMLTAAQHPSYSLPTYSNPRGATRFGPPVPFHAVPVPTFKSTKTVAQTAVRSKPNVQLSPLPPPPPSLESSSLTPSQLYKIKSKIRDLHVELQQELEKAKSIVVNYNTLREGWKAKENTAMASHEVDETHDPGNKTSVEYDQTYVVAIQNAERLKRELESLQADLTPEKLRTVRRKMVKASKRKEWKKRRITQMQEYRDTTEERRQKLNAEIDRNREKTLTRDMKKEKKKQARRAANQERRQEIRKKAQDNQVATLLHKLQRLKTLRRDRMKREGHFFPEEGNEFFEKIRKAEEALNISGEKGANQKPKPTKKKKEGKKSERVNLEAQKIVNSVSSDVKVCINSNKDAALKMNDVIPNGAINSTNVASNSITSKSTSTKAAKRTVADELTFTTARTRSRKIPKTSKKKELNCQKWEAFRITPEHRVGDQARATSIPDDLEDLPAEPSSPAWAEYLRPIDIEVSDELDAFHFSAL
ncbi:hypothetical protein BGX27_010799 [Mortierella sp. AM989]|nr:hypothetical protein BGX27_010799 [Mortierella sp. AM989]